MIAELKPNRQGDPVLHIIAESYHEYLALEVWRSAAMHEDASDLFKNEYLIFESTHAFREDG